MYGNFLPHPWFFSFFDKSILIIVIYPYSFMKYLCITSYYFFLLINSIQMHNGFAGLSLIEFLPLRLAWYICTFYMESGYYMLYFTILLDILDQHKVTLCNLFKMLLNNINRNYWRMVNFDRLIKR